MFLNIDTDTDSERRIFVFEVQCDRKFMQMGWSQKVISEELLYYKSATKFHDRK